MKNTYPKAFITPNGRAVSIRTMQNALRQIRKNPQAEYPGWNWFSTPGYMIVNEFRRGLHDRINRRAQ